MRASCGIYLLLLLSLNAVSQSPYNYNQQKVLECRNAAVVSAHPLASEAGVTVMKQGGNAVDAAIATQLALAVVYPGAGNLGGGGFLIAHFNTGKTLAIDYREKAPGKADKDMYLDESGIPVKMLSQEGHLASGVPGTVAGLFQSLKYARLDFKKLIEPAITLAEKGFAITESQAASFNNNRTEFKRVNKNPVAFLKQRPWKAGDTLIQKDLAATLKRIRDKGMKGFYEGETARLIVKEMKAGKGIISLSDLKNYRAKERPVIQFVYKDYNVITMPLPSSGGIMLKQMLTMAEKKGLSSHAFHSTEAVQIMIEAERRAYADRANYMGDLDFVKVPVKQLMSDDYLDQRIADYIPGKAGNSRITKAGAINESEETTHISIIDSYGNAVSVTTTLNDSYGSKLVISGAGFLMNNEMDDFSVKEGFPNMYGAIGNAANAISPGKRMLSSMTPVILLRNKKPFLIAGTPGGTTIPTSMFQTIVNIADFKLSAEDAVNKPKFHFQWLPDTVFIERNFPVEVANNLTLMGYTVIKRSDIGRTEVILVDEAKKNKITAVADRRGDDDAEGY